MFNRTSEKLKGGLVYNPRKRWVLCPNAFPAIVSQEMFNRAQCKLNNRVIRRSDERLLEELRTYIESHGKSLPRPVHVGDLASPATYRLRFGGLMQAYEQIHYQPARYTMATLARHHKVAALRAQVVEDLMQAFARAQIRIVKEQRSFSVRRKGKFLLKAAKSYTITKRRVRWTVYSWQILGNIASSSFGCSRGMRL